MLTAPEVTWATGCKLLQPFLVHASLVKNKPMSLQPRLPKLSPQENPQIVPDLKPDSPFSECPGWNARFIPSNRHNSLSHRARNGSD
eukprot:5768751-Amphidinium_carterae.1